jgi:hypothetical protein
LIWRPFSAMMGSGKRLKYIIQKEKVQLR